MKRKISKFISALTTITLCLQMLPICAYAQSVESSGGGAKETVILQENNTYVTSEDTNILPIETNVVLKFDSLGVADNAKIIGLTQGKRYKITFGSTTKYVKADGTLSDNEADAGKILGTEIIGLTNGETYDVQRYFEKPKMSGNSYLISSPDDLMWISQNNTANEGFSGDYFVQTQDIDMSDENFEPIGDKIAFNGKYNGNLYRIKSLIVNKKINKVDNSNKFEYAGLFGVIDYGIIENVIIENANIKIECDNSDTLIYAGGIAGSAGWGKPGEFNVSGSEINNCHIVSTDNKSSFISAKGKYCYIGGIVGNSNMTYPITKCSADTTLSLTEDAEIQSLTSIGGIAGACKNHIENSCYTGEISSLGETRKLYIGGIVGKTEGDIIDCYTTTTVCFKESIFCEPFIGGVIGSKYLYDFDSLSNKSNHRNTFYLDTISSNAIANGNIDDNGILSKTEQELKQAETYKEWDKEIWLIEEGKYPISRSIIYPLTRVRLYKESLGIAGEGMVTDLVSRVAYRVLKVHDKHSLYIEHCYYVKADGTLSDEERDVAPLTGTKITGLDNRSCYWIQKYYPAPEGEGTQENPYKISKSEDLIWMSQNNYIKKGFEDIYFKQTKNIDMSGINFKPIGIDWSFAGNYDGGNYKISNLLIQSKEYSVGMFSSTSGSTLQNIILENTHIEAVNPPDRCSSIGGVVGNSGETNIINCHIISTQGSNSIIRDNAKDSVIGGIVGGFNGGGKISKCSVDAIIKADVTATGTHDKNLIGGIVGTYFNNDFTIENCMSNARIDVQRNTSGRIELGGIIGSYSNTPNTNCEINNCYFSGQLNGKVGLDSELLIGGIAGCKCDDVTAKNCFFLNTSASKGVGTGSEAGVTPKTDAELKTVSTFDTWDNAIWFKTEGQYPVLKTLAEALNADNSIKTAVDDLMHLT